MSPTAVPRRITIDFRDALLPSRTWILGVDETPARVDLLAFEAADPAPVLSTTRRGVTLETRYWRPATASVAECACPEFCERDHANE